MKGQLQRYSDTRWQYRLGKKTYYIRQADYDAENDRGTYHVEGHDEIVEGSGIADLCDWIDEGMPSMVKTTISSMPKQIVMGAVQVATASGSVKATLPTWFCPNCGATTSGQSCGQCGGSAWAASSPNTQPPSRSGYVLTHCPMCYKVLPASGICLDPMCRTMAAQPCPGCGDRLSYATYGLSGNLRCSGCGYSVIVP